MAWEADSRRRATLPPGWSSRVVPRILRRDHHHCLWGSLPEDHYPLGLCANVATEVDHCGDNADHRDENLRSLCRWHHGKRSGRQGGLASAEAGRRRKAARRLPEEPHPGGAAGHG